MKKKIRCFIFAAIALLVGSFWFLSFRQILKKKAIIEQFETLPPIEMFTLQNEKIQLTDFSFDEVKLLIYFNSHCDFCHYELEELSKRIPEFENTEIILVSAEPIDTIKHLGQAFGLQAFPNAGVYHCPFDTLQKYFGQMAAPTTFVYGTNNELVKHFKGATRIDDLLQVVQTAQVNESTRDQ
jgi:peroxiredoxin